MRSLTCLLFVILTLCPAAPADTLPQRPLDTILPWSLDRGRWEFGAGVLRREGVSPPFFGEARGTRRDEWRATILDASLGLGGGEVQVRFGVQRFDEDGGLSKSGIEDARIAFTYQLPVETVAAALRFEVKLPNAPNDSRLGTDETDLFMLGAVGRRQERWGWAGNLGFGILGDPREAAVQDDVLLFGAAGWFAPAGSAGQVTLLMEASGMAASRFGNDFRLLRVGVRLGRWFPVDLSVRRGLTAPSEDWGLEAGVTLYAPRESNHS